MAPVDLDEKDLKIIEMLQKNSRASYSEIAKAIGISDVATIKRVKRLERIGVIKRYTILVDPKKMGYSVISLTGIDVEPQNIFDVLMSLKSKEYVKFLALTSGDHSIMATIWSRDSQELARIHNEISSMPGVKRVCPAIIQEIIKE